MAANSTVVLAETLRSLASSSISGTYQIVGTPTSNPCRLVKFVNNSTEDITVSWDGINNHDYIPAGGFSLYDLGTNRGNASPELNIRANTSFWVKGTAGAGNIYIVVLYANTPSQTYGV